MTIKVTYNVTDVYMTQSVSPVYINVSYSDGSGGAAVWGGITGTLSNQTDLQTALDAKLDESIIDGGAEGQILVKNSATDFDFAWINNYAKYLATNVRNQSGSTIAAFQVVYISGATGNKPLISLADADTEATSSKTYGVTATAIANNGTGDVVTAGELSGIDTSAFTEGDSLWLSTTAGGVVTTPPAEPAHSVFIGTVVRSHPNLGVIDVAIQNGYELNELHGVLITSAANNQGLFYNSANGLWENKSIATVLGYTPEQPLTFNAPLSRAGNVVSIPQATGSVNGFLSATDWTTFNSKQSALGYTPANAATTLTINGVTYDLSANRSWTISAGISGTIASGQVAYGTAANTIGGSNNLFWDAATSRLGIGTNMPAFPLQINYLGLSTNANPGFEVATTATSSPMATFSVNGNSTTGHKFLISHIGGTDNSAYLQNYSTSAVSYRGIFFLGNQLTFEVTNTNYAARIQAIRVFGNGNVGIGTTTDDGVNRLQVSGNAKVTGQGLFGTGSPTSVYTRGLTLSGTSGDISVGVFNSNTSSGTTGIVLGESNSVYALYAKWGSTYSGNYPASSIPLANSSQFQSGATNNLPFIIQGTPIILNVGNVSTNIASRISAGSFRITSLANAHTNGTALLDLDAATTSYASLRIRSGTAPTTPNDGDIWFDGTDIKMRIGGVTKTFTLV